MSKFDPIKRKLNLDKMKKTLLFLCIITLLGSPMLSSCTRVNPKCKQNAKKVKKLRKNNPHMVM